VVQRYDVSEVHTPHFVVWKYLSEHLVRLAPGARLLGELHPEDHERAYRALRARVAAVGPGPFGAIPAQRPALTLLERSGLLRLVATIPGMCAEEKMHAVIEAMRRAPPGDIVEIGSWWGRSAALFVWLSRRYDLAKCCVSTPGVWRPSRRVTPCSTASASTSTPKRPCACSRSTLPRSAGDRLNYIRAPSVEGAAL